MSEKKHAAENRHNKSHLGACASAPELLDELLLPR